jgi:hypothetical protein
VCAWFAYLIQQKSVRNIWQHHPDFRVLYETLMRAVTHERQLWFIFISCLLLVLVSRQYFYGGACLIFFYLGYRIHNKKKSCIEQISRQLILDDFTSETLGKKTLYQICEYYASRYHIASLVDFIGFTNDILRKTMVIVTLILWLIYPLNAILTISEILIAYYLIQQIVTSFWALQYLSHRKKTA